MRKGQCVLAALVGAGMLCAFVLTSAGATNGTVRVQAQRSPDSLWRGNGWRIDTAAVIVSIGVVGGDTLYELNGVSRVVRTTSGGFAIAESSELGTWIKVFDSRGRFMHRMGRRGQGPGEFVTITSLASMPGDSIYTYDQMARRITIFDPRGRVARTTQTFVEGSPVPTSLLPLANGALVGSYTTTSARAGPIATGGTPYYVRDTLVLVRFDSTSRALRRILVLPNQQALWSGTIGLFHRYTNRAYWTVSGNSIWAASNDRVAIGQYDSEGRLQRTIRVPSMDVRLERDSIQAERARWQRDIARGGAAGTYATINLAHAVFPEYRPRFNAIAADAQGNLWLQTPSQNCIVIRGDGQLLGTVPIPGNRRLYAFGDSWTLTVSFDEMGVQRVQQLRILK